MSAVAMVGASAGRKCISLTWFSNAVLSGANESAFGQSFAVRIERCNDQRGFRLSIAKVIDQEHAAMRLRVAMDEGSYVAVFADKNALLAHGLG
jgi:hypothetical protein